MTRVETMVEAAACRFAIRCAVRPVHLRPHEPLRLRRTPAGPRPAAPPALPSLHVRGGTLHLGDAHGRRAGRLTWISTYHTSKSVMNETAHLYLGEELDPADRVPDDTEFIERRVFPFAEILEMVRRAEITDSMTVIAVPHAALRPKEGRAAVPPVEG